MAARRATGRRTASAGKKRATAARTTKTRTPSPKDVVRAIESAWGTNKLDRLDRYFAPSFRSESAIPMLPPGLEGAKMAHQMSMQAMPDRRTKILDMIQEGTKIAVRMQMTGTNSGGMPWFGAPPNNAKVDAGWISVYEIRNGKATRHWAVNDGFAILTQVGAFTPPDM